MIQLSNIIFFNQLEENDYSLSAKLYEQYELPYENSKKLSEFLISPLQKGIEVGSDAYIDNKKFKFIRTNGISNSSVLFDEKSCVGVPKSYFEKQNLKKDGILIVKDGSIGNVAFLDKDFPNYMISSGINLINCKNPLYVFSILQHYLFKQNFYYKVTSGFTISHAENIFLDFDIPLPKSNEEEVMSFIEIIMKSIISKERLIKYKINCLNNYISKLLNFEDFEELDDVYPTYADLIKVKRIDSGYYSKKSIYVRNLIESYCEGYFYISSSNIKGGNTPKIRSNPSYEDLAYKWIMPSYINDDGLNVNVCSMDFKGKNNINQDVCLIVNRTSKKSDGQSGKFVGIASFYDYSFFKEGHHNQGFYRIENLDKIDLIMITTLFNHPIYREYFGEISVGSKMKEVKKYNLVEIPLPKFDRDIKEKLKELYFNELSWNFTGDIKHFNDYDNKWSQKAGIYDLYLMSYRQKMFLNSLIEKIYNNQDIEITFSF